MSSIFNFDNSYARDLPDFYIAWQPEKVARPELLFFNDELATEIGLRLTADDEDTVTSIFSGNRLPEGASPIAQAYAGHQFGHFSPQLGDGRALLLGEVIDQNGKRRDIAFKGSGRTPFSRSGDGKAAVGPMLREVLIGEAMHALGVPSTRGLAVVATGETVYRTQPLNGAILTRVADSHLRVGTFEFFAARGAVEQLRALADYAIARHYPDLQGKENRYVEFLQAVGDRQAALIAQWMNIGFIHGVMNTDNMSVAGESIDYGPCAFLEAYDPRAVFSSIDEHGRYAFGNQPRIANWNLAKLAEALLPILADEENEAIAQANRILNDFYDVYRRYWLAGVRAKLGLKQENESDAAIAEAWLSLLQAQGVDFTLAWRRLADATEGDASALKALFEHHAALDGWLSEWQARCRLEDGSDRSARSLRANAMRAVNPSVIPRNHLVEEALDAASHHGDLTYFEQLLQALKQPYADNPASARFAEPAPSSFTSSYRTFCGT